jgi:hypothetical protein
MPVALLVITARVRERLRWLNRVVLTACRSLPVYPDERTSSEPAGMYARHMTVLPHWRAKLLVDFDFH